MTPLLAHGHVELKRSFGDDLVPVNFARASLERESAEMTERDERLLRFLATADPPHSSPFYACALDFSIRAPLMVARQWWKHTVGSRHVDDPFAAWNERTLRQPAEQLEFYAPGPGSIAWRRAPASGKQGSAEPVDFDTSESARQVLTQVQHAGRQAYERLLALGVCAEQARLALPAYGLFVSWRWVASLEAVRHFVALRDERTAQVEIQLYARAVEEETRKVFPKAWEALRG